MHTERDLFGLEVSITANCSRSPLLSAASVLHRRGIDVVEASLIQRSAGDSLFSATFRSAAGQAQTVLRSFENLIETTDAVLTNLGNEAARH